MSDMKRVMGKSFESFLFYSNLKYGKFREPYLAHATLNLLINCITLITYFRESIGYSNTRNFNKNSINQEHHNILC